VTVTFQNRLAGFLWGFAAVWLTMLLAMTYVVLRDGPPEGSSAPTVVIVMALFWIGGIGLGAFVSTKPCIFVTIEQGNSVSATWRYPHKVVRRVLPAASVLPAAVIDSRDSDGDPYFYARANTIDGEPIDITEGHSQKDCEQACERFNSALYSEFIGRVQSDVAHGVQRERCDGRPHNR
jgi:hypothetical protein